MSQDTCGDSEMLKKNKVGLEMPSIYMFKNMMKNKLEAKSHSNGLSLGFPK